MSSHCEHSRFEIPYVHIGPECVHAAAFLSRKTPCNNKNSTHTHTYARPNRSRDQHYLNWQRAEKIHNIAFDKRINARDARKDISPLFAIRHLMDHFSALSRLMLLLAAGVKGEHAGLFPVFPVLCSGRFCRALFFGLHRTTPRTAGVFALMIIKANTSG